jgi:hypothetical protein
MQRAILRSHATEAWALEAGMGKVDARQLLQTSAWTSLTCARVDVFEPKPLP